MAVLVPILGSHVDENEKKKKKDVKICIFKTLKKKKKYSGDPHKFWTGSMQRFPRILSLRTMDGRTDEG